MSVLAVGLSHRTAPVSSLERAALAPVAATGLATALVDGEFVSEAFVLSTCNRVEVYADVERFHGGVSAVSEGLAAATGTPLDALMPHLYVHYEDRAVEHLFRVACGLDSMVVGEGQVLGQIKQSLRRGQGSGAVGGVLNELVQHALRVGKRAHAETSIDRAGQSLVSVGLDLAEDTLGRLQGRRGLVVGAGSMAALSAVTLHRRGLAEVVVLNRTPAHAQRLAETVQGRAGGLEDLAAELARADVVVSSTGAVGTVVAADAVRAAQARRGGDAQVLLDLALPRDVDPRAREVPGVCLVDIEHLADVLRSSSTGDDLDAVRRIVADEVAAFGGWQRATSVAPTVVALRAMAADVVEAELLRLGGRLPQLDERARAEIAQSVRRVVDKLLHAPTVRVKELAGEPGGHAYAEALHQLFDLDPRALQAAPARALEQAVPGRLEQAVPGRLEQPVRGGGT